MAKIKNNIIEAKAEIAQATKEAGTLLANQAEDAIKVIATAAAEALKVTNVQTSGDHDLIIKLDTKMDAIIADIRDLKDGTTKRIDNLETEKLNIKDSYPTLYKTEVERISKDHEERLRRIEDNMFKWMGAIGVITFVVTFLVGYLLKLIK